jgi:hypothetical protein
MYYPPFDLRADTAYPARPVVESLDPYVEGTQPTPIEFLEQYINKNLFNDSQDLKRSEFEFYDDLYHRSIQDKISPPIRVDTRKLNLDEFRQPGRSYPGEFLDRDKFVTSPSGPLT